MFLDNDSAHDAEPLCASPVVALVVRARGGDERAWAALVERYAPLIWSLCRRYRLDLAGPGLPRPDANVTLRAGRVLPMRLIRRG